jgi:isopenicillin-N epimerase
LIVRISAHYYNLIEQYEYLAEVLNSLLLEPR